MRQHGVQPANLAPLSEQQPRQPHRLLRELEPEGLLLSTTYDSEEQAKDLLAKVPGWAVRSRWTVP